MPGSNTKHHKHTLEFLKITLSILFSCILIFGLMPTTYAFADSNNDSQESTDVTNTTEKSGSTETKNESETNNEPENQVNKTPDSTSQNESDTAANTSGQTTVIPSTANNSSTPDNSPSNDGLIYGLWVDNGTEDGELLACDSDGNRIDDPNSNVTWETVTNLFIERETVPGYRLFENYDGSGNIAPNITEITCLDSCITLEEGAFTGNDESLAKLKTVKISASTVNVPDSIFTGNNANAYQVEVPENNPHFSSDGSGIYRILDNDDLASFPEGSVEVGQNELMAWTNSSITILTPSNFKENTVAIGSSAFSEKNLQSIELPNSVTCVGSYAFSDNPNLTSITIPASVTDLAYDLRDRPDYSTCAGMVSYHSPQAHYCVDENNEFYASDNGRLFDKLYMTLYAWNFAEGDITVPNRVRTIGNGAFSYSNITSVTMPPSVGRLGSQSLAYCTQLADVVFQNPSGVRPADYQVFGYNGISAAEHTTIHVPSTSLEQYEKYINTSYEGTEHLELTTYDIYGKITSFSSDFDHETQVELCNNDGSAVTSDAENYIEAIGEQVLDKDIDYGKLASEDTSGESTGTDSFLLDARLITSLFVDCDVPDYAFNPYYSSALELTNAHTITILDGCTSMGRNVFYQDESFSFLPNLKTIHIEGEPSINENTFGGLPNLITFTANSDAFTAENGALYNKDKTGLISWPTATGTVTVPGSIKTVYPRAFENAGLEGIYFEEGVEQIGSFAFLNCNNLTKISLPNSASQLAYDMSDESNPHLYLGAFISNCPKASIEASASNPTFTTQNGALYSKDMTHLYAWPSANGDIVVPEGVKEVDYLALNNEAITSITFPTTLTTLEQLAVGNLNSDIHITFLSSTPPSFNNQSLGISPEHFSFTVPASALKAYQDALVNFYSNGKEPISSEDLVIETADETTNPDEQPGKQPGEGNENLNNENDSISDGDAMDNSTFNESSKTNLAQTSDSVNMFLPIGLGVVLLIALIGIVFALRKMRRKQQNRLVFPKIKQLPKALQPKARLQF